MRGRAGWASEAAIFKGEPKQICDRIRPGAIGWTEGLIPLKRHPAAYRNLVGQDHAERLLGLFLVGQDHAERLLGLFLSKVLFGDEFGNDLAQLSVFFHIHISSPLFTLI